MATGRRERKGLNQEGEATSSARSRSLLLLVLLMLLLHPDDVLLSLGILLLRLRVLLRLVRVRRRVRHRALVRRRLLLLRDVLGLLVAERRRRVLRRGARVRLRRARDRVRVRVRRRRVPRLVVLQALVLPAREERQPDRAVVARVLVVVACISRIPPC